MKSIFVFFCFAFSVLTLRGQGFPSLDLSDNGTVIKLDGLSDHFWMRARVEQTFDAKEAVSELNARLEEHHATWLRARNFRIDPNKNLQGAFYFVVQANRDSVVRRFVFPSYLNDSYLEILQYPVGSPHEYTLSGGCPCYYPGRIVHLTLDGSEEGVEYELFRENTKEYALSGTGEALTFPITKPGTYSVRAAREHIFLWMNGSVRIEQSPVFRDCLSFVSSRSVSLSPDGERLEIPFTFTGTSDVVFSALREACYSCMKGESRYWDSTFKFICRQTASDAGVFIILRGPNLRDTELKSYFILDADKPRGVLTVRQPPGGRLRVVNVSGGGELSSGSTGTISLSATQLLVTYRLYCNDSLVATQPNSPFTGLTSYGHYRVQATYDGYDAWMNGSAAIWPEITRFTIGGGGNQINNRDVEVTLNGSEEGLTYRLLCNGIVLDSLPGTGTALSFSVSSPGVYRVDGGLQDHYVPMDGSAEVYRNSTVGFSPDHSYTAVRTYLSSGGVTWRESVRYLDGLGRPLQDVQVHASPDGSSDLVQPYVYGRGGRVEKTLLPYPSTCNCGNFDKGFSDASNWSIYGAAEQSHAFSQTEYDGSPLNRVTKQIGPGYARHAGGRGITTSYGYNGAEEVRLYRVSASGGLLRSGYYAAGRLEKTTMTDEDGLVTESYTDNAGRTVLAVSQNGAERLETYTVYDALGRVRWVLSPEASHRLGNGTDTAVLNRYAYRYDYDRRSRLIEKRLPGMGPVYYVYDGKDRPVLSQDGEQRKTATWSYTLYDRYNREIETGETMLADKTAVQLRTEAEASRDYHPSGARTPCQYFLYDSYTASSDVIPHAFVATPGFDSTFHPWVTGQLTATKTRILGSDNWHTNTQYYDERGRVIQSVEDNRLGGLSRIDMLYDFIDNPVKLRESHGKTDGSTDVLESENSYDAQGRLLTQSITLNGGTAATLTYSYDALGRLIVKRYGSVDESLAYNIQGWLTGKESAPFRMRLRYENPEGGSVARWNGSLSEWEWQHGTSPAMLYGFSYDGQNRFTGAVQKQKSGNAWSALTGDYVEKGLTYDRNGNLQTLQRTAGGRMVDNLTYTYSGNHLISLSERVRTASSDDIYAPGTSESGTYAYDLNGNLKKDSRRALLFDYNSLNLLGEVRRDGQPVAKYTWLADGTKLGVRDGSGESGFEYVGSLIYRKSGSGFQLDEAMFGDGVIRENENGTQEVDYFLTDHLGSVRVIVDAAGEVKERNDYYPFGARHVRSDYAQNTNRWKYNGKELQTTGDLGFLDYGARMYDMSVGRWFGMDPLTEKYSSLGGYVFSGNNPLLFVDENGSFFTHYVDKDYNVLFQTDDGSDDVVMVPDEYVDDFRKYSDFSSELDCIFNSLGWNKYWKNKFGLAARQFSELELMFLDVFSIKKSRNNAAAYLLNPTAGRLISMSFWESLGQWTNIETVVGNLSAGIGLWSGISKIGNVGRKTKNVYSHNHMYMERVQSRAEEEAVFHDFPYSFDDVILSNVKPRIKHDAYQLYRMKGSINGMEGFYEIGINKNGMINHRFFKPLKHKKL